MNGEIGREEARLIVQLEIRALDCGNWRRAIKVVEFGHLVHHSRVNDGRPSFENSTKLVRNSLAGSASRLVLEVRHLKLVQAVAREASVTRAAPCLNLTQSALSHQLLKLERELGAKLFHRIGKRMSPTAAGVALVETADTVLSTLAEAELRVRKGNELRQTLRVSAGCFSYYTWLSGALGRFGAAQPDVDVQVGLQGTRREIPALFADEIDVAITAQPPSDERLERLRLFELDVVALLPKSHQLSPGPEQSRSGVRWLDLQEETILTLDVSDDDLERLRAAIGREARIWRVQLTEAIVELVKGGHGVAIITLWPGLAPSDPEIARVPLLPRQKREFWMAWRGGNPRNLPMLELAAHLARDIGRSDTHLRR